MFENTMEVEKKDIEFLIRLAEAWLDQLDSILKVNFNQNYYNMWEKDTKRLNELKSKYKLEKEKPFTY